VVLPTAAFSFSENHGSQQSEKTKIRALPAQNSKFISRLV
jgi:hypothetical protein